MQRVYVKDIRDNLEKCILVQGFVENFRDGKAMCFIVLKDITGRVQITIEKDEHPDLLPALGQITPDSVISVIGVAHESEYVKMGGIEIFPTEIKVESIAAALPIQREDIPATKKKAAVARSGIDDRMDYRWIDLRTDRNQLIFKAQTLFTKAMRDFLYERGFLEIHTPKLIGARARAARRFLRSNILTATHILLKVLSFISRWLWQVVLTEFLRSVPYSAQRNHIPTSILPSLPALT